VRQLHHVIHIICPESYIVGISFIYIYCLLPSALSNYKWTVSWSHSLALTAPRPCLKCSTSHATSLFPRFSGTPIVVTAPRHVLISAIQLPATRWSPSHVATSDRYDFSTHISVPPMSLFGNIPWHKIYATNNHIISFTFIPWIRTGLQNPYGYGNIYICLRNKEVKSVKSVQQFLLLGLVQYLRF
jgi:hypothetical protein